MAAVEVADDFLDKIDDLVAATEVLSTRLPGVPRGAVDDDLVHGAATLLPTGRASTL